MKINFGQFIHALSDTIDLVGADAAQHGKRVAYMAMECAKTMGLSEDGQLSLSQVGLLHDCGVSSIRMHKKLMEESGRDQSDLRCRIGADLMRRFPPFAEFADTILYHHRRWQELKDLPLPDTVKRNANLICLLNQVDVLATMQNTPNRLATRDIVCRKVSSLGDTHFQSDLVEVFLAAAEKESFWIIQESVHLRDYLQDRITKEQEVDFDTKELKDMGLLFARIVDAKSPYTAEHSCGVGALSGYLARQCGLTDRVCGEIEVAGLLHDLGKLQVPDTILDFNGKLEGDSLAVMRHHSFVTYTILNSIHGLEEIAQWSSNHHEKLDGSGYPFKRTADELSLESRIVMVADIFQAMAQPRPYRAPQSPDKIIEVLEQHAAKGQLDKELVQIVKFEASQCHEAAMRQWH